MRDLMQNPPSVIVVVRNDALPQVTGNQRDSAAELLNFPALSRMIQTKYEYSVSFEDLDIYSAKTSTLKPVQ